MRRVRRGFTLIELLVVAGVVATIVALLAPAAEQAHLSARRAVTLTRLRTHASVLAIYAIDWRDAYPAFTNPADSRHIVYSELHGQPLECSRYFFSSVVWCYALADSYYGVPPLNPVFYDAERPASVVGGEPFVMSCTLFAEPAFWDPATRTPTGQLRGVFQHEVLFPDHKRTILSGYGIQQHSGTVNAPLIPGPDTEIPSANADGGAHIRTLATSARGVASGDGVYEYSMHFADFVSGTHTLHGVRGIDDRR